MPFPPHQPKELQAAFDKAIRQTLLSMYPEVTAKTIVNFLETSVLHPTGWNIQFRIEMQVSPLDKKETPK